MKKVLIFCMLSTLLSGICWGEIILDDGLVLQGGQEQIEMHIGERTYLRIQHSVWKYPVLKNLEFSSKKPWVASIDNYGWVNAQSTGRTVISVWNDEGENGTIEVIVRARQRAPTWVICCLVILLISSLFVYFFHKKISLF